MSRIACVNFIELQIFKVANLKKLFNLFTFLPLNKNFEVFGKYLILTDLHVLKIVFMLECFLFL